MKKIRGIIFDKDGTLFDFSASWSPWVASVLVELSGGNPEFALRLGASIGYDLTRKRFAPDSIVIAGTADDISAALIGNLTGWEVDALVEFLKLSAGEVRMQEAVPLRGLLSELRKDGMPTGIATNDSETAARSHIRDAGIEDFFDFIVGYDSGFGAKPEPGMLTGACEKLKLKPESVLMVGDSPHDMIAGRAAGMRTAGVLTGVYTEDDLAPNADVILRDIGELPEYLSIGL